MRLSEYIRLNSERITEAWAEFARSILPAAATMDDLALRDHCAEILGAIAADIETAQTGAEAIAKSQGLKKRVTYAAQTAAHIHGELRHESGFTIDQLAAEYRALRSSVHRLWRAEKAQLDSPDLFDLERFNEAIDEALAESIARHSELVDDAREMFLAILGHDLRTPLNAIAIASETLRLGNTPDVVGASDGIRHNTNVINEMVVELLEFVRTRLAKNMPLRTIELDMREICEAAIAVCQTPNPKVAFRLDVSGETRGQWDRHRLEQLVRNLISNAVQHGQPGAVVSVSVTGAHDIVSIIVENTGPPIPANVLQSLFNPLVRIGKPDISVRRPTDGLGLGLFIVREIATAHGGTVQVRSAAGRTRFIVELPRQHTSA